jgi:hypothetical protein
MILEARKSRHKVSRSVYTEVKNRVSDPYSFDTDPDPDLVF